MDPIDTLFGHGKDLSTLNMCCRIVVTFIITLVLLRISGRRSFGMRSPLDNIIVILLGAVLSRGVVGASPFLPVIACCFLLVTLHRAFAWLVLHNERLSVLLQGKDIVLFDNQKMIKENMDRALVAEREIEQALRTKGNTSDFGKVKQMRMERSGEISVIKADS